jgi:flagellar basal body-associated protein FliL
MLMQSSLYFTWDIMKAKKNILFFAAYFVALTAFVWAGYFFYADYTLRSKAQTKPLLPGQFQTDITYIDLPRITVALSSNSGHGNNIHMDISLEVETKYATNIEGYRSRIKDRLIDYMRSLNYDDLIRPKSTLWLKPELLNIVNTASDPLPIKDVIFREFIVL